MNQSERRSFLLRYLLDEQPTYRGTPIPKGEAAQKKLLRSLFNIRAPKGAEDGFFEVQDAYLQTEIAESGVVDAEDFTPVSGDLCLWQGDITRLKCDAVVNAANSELIGCFYPCHGCIDNAIHTFAGIQLRLECAEIMRKQGRGEPVGRAKITSAYNLPSRYILHTVGPVVRGIPTKKDCELLASCYRSCLELAESYGVRSIAFCCISTGEFCFPNERAAEIAVRTVKDFKNKTHSGIKVIFNVFKNIDREIYGRLLG